MKRLASTYRDATVNTQPSSSASVSGMIPEGGSSEPSAQAESTPTSITYSPRPLTPGERERAELLAGVALSALAELRRMGLLKMTINNTDIIIRFPLSEWTTRFELRHD
jgi:hypothetical protein